VASVPNPVNPVHRFSPPRDAAQCGVARLVVVAAEIARDDLIEACGREAEDRGEALGADAVELEGVVVVGRERLAGANSMKAACSYAARRRPAVEIGRMPASCLGCC